MTHANQRYLLDIVTENNEMLKYIIKVLNTYLLNHSKENEEDFNRNVLANLVSNVFAIDKRR